MYTTNPNINSLSDFIQSIFLCKSIGGKGVERNIENETTGDFGAGNNVNINHCKDFCLAVLKYMFYVCRLIITVSSCLSLKKSLREFFTNFSECLLLSHYKLRLSLMFYYLY